MAASSCNRAEESADRKSEAATRAQSVEAERADELDTLDAETRAQLEALGYLAGYEETPEQTGTTFFDQERVQPGYNLFISGHAPAAFLMDMEGKVLHTWSYDASQLYPISPSRDYWRRVYLSDSGELYALISPHGVIKLTTDSDLIYHTDGKHALHHDLFVDDSGMLFALGRRIAPIPEVHPSIDVIDDTVVVFDDRGHKVKSFSIYNAFRGTEWFDDVTKRIRSILRAPADAGVPPTEAFHTNTIEVFDGSLVGVSPFLEKGNAVFCSPIHQNVFIIDLEAEKVVWNWFGPWKRGIHQPTFLPNGNWLLFDNAVEYTSEDDAASGVIEYTFPSKERVWQYTGVPEGQHFYSRFSSLAQRLENGNTLIVVSNEGRAIEVTPTKERVWEYYNPHSVKHDMLGRKGFAARGDGSIIGTLFQLERVPMQRHDDWLNDRGE